MMWPIKVGAKNIIYVVDNLNVTKSKVRIYVVKTLNPTQAVPIVQYVVICNRNRTTLQFSSWKIVQILRIRW